MKTFEILCLLAVSVITVSCASINKSPLSVVVTTFPPTAIPTATRIDPTTGATVFSGDFQVSSMGDTVVAVGASTTIASAAASGETGVLAVAEPGGALGLAMSDRSQTA